MPERLTDPGQIREAVRKAMAAQPVSDLHTHLYTPAFGTPVPNAAGNTDAKGLMLWGIDEQVTYHYLVAEMYRFVHATELPYEKFWAMSKTEQADLIWKTLFVDHTPISEPTRGVLTTLARLGLDPNEKTLEPYRKWFRAQDPSDYIDRAMETAGVDVLTMTNAVFDDGERARWLADPAIGGDPRFRAALRIDPLLRNWPLAAQKLSDWGYPCSQYIDDKSVEQASRFLRDWIDRMKAVYVAASLGPEFRYPANPASAVESAGQQVLERVVVPVCEERGIPFAMMIGSRLRINPALGDAGDMAGKADPVSVANIAAAFPKCRFLVTMLAREDQYEICVAARKFDNLVLFGCWWFLNSPGFVEEITRMRVEWLGTSFIPQHSDARVLDQIIYKWDHSREVIGEVLADKYALIAGAGRIVTTDDIKRDVALLLRDNYRAEVRV